MASDRLVRLADLLRQRNAIDVEIASVLGRPALAGHIGEFIAAEVFDIELHHSATQKGTDGVFRSGSLSGRTVNVRLYGFQEGTLDTQAEHPPDVYLVLTGEARAAASSRGGHRPLVIRHAYAFRHEDLVGAGVRLGTASSVRRALWESAEIWPGRGEGALLGVSSEQAAQLALLRE